jgi:hypothetical protein
MTTQLKYTFLFLICVVPIVLLNLSYETRSTTIPSAPPPLNIKLFLFGQDETVADVYWLKALQNFNVCEQDRGGSSYAPNGARMGLNRTPSCSYGWLSRTLYFIGNLVPRFRFLFVVGPTVLSTIVDDIDGATELYKLAVKLYPNDWLILSRAATHFALEVENRPVAAQLYLRAVENGAPTWMGLYASKLFGQEGLHNLSIRILRDFSKNTNLSARDRAYIEEKLKAEK